MSQPEQPVDVGRDVDVDVVVLGGGAAGLTAAWRAAVTGSSVLLLERSAGLGGLAASFDVAGIRVDHGSHRLHPATDPRLLTDLRELLGVDLQTRPRNGRLRLYDRWFAFPLSFTELLRGVPRRALGRIVRDTVTAPLRRAGGHDSSYGRALTASLGPELYGVMYGPYAEKLWGLPGTRIDREQARTRVSADRPWKIARRLLARNSLRGRIFYYPRRGFGQIVEALAEAARRAGARLQTGAEVISVEQCGTRSLVRLGDGSAVRAGHVLSTLPLPVLARLVQPPAAAAVRADADRLRLRAMVLVYLVHHGGRWTPYDAHYLPDRATPITRISEPANYRESAEDPTDRSVVCAEIPCEVDGEIWCSTPDRLAALVTATVAAVGLPPLAVADVVVRRLRHVYPIFERGYARHLQPLQAWADGLPGVTTLGRQGLFVHDNTHHTMAMAYAAVDCLRPDDTRDETAWAAARAGFTEHVVED